MFEIQEKPKMVERALLVGVYENHEESSLAGGLLEELEELVNTLGVPVYERLLIRIRKPQARFFVGAGKVEEIIDLVKAEKLDVIIFDNELSPAQQRNLERAANVCVIDRQEVILDIFAQRAQTKEARLQVRLARLEYSLPRLTRAWTHLGQQGGGIGAKGEGEKQLEIDKRLVRRQIEQVKRELETVRRHRATQRKERRRVPVPNAAIVGYTNAGKSSLLRLMTGANVLVEDKLFATLDTVTRRIVLPNNQPLLLTDTVGFVRKLPHDLVEAFNATLEEAVLADFLIHLLDASQPEVFDFYQTTRKVLDDLGAGDKKTITVFNKIDKVQDPLVIKSLRIHFPEAIFISVKREEGIDELMHLLSGFLTGGLQTLTLRIPHDRSDLIAKLHRHARVFHTRYDPDSVHLSAAIPAKFLTLYENFIENPSKPAEISI